MLILAGISLNLVLGQNGIISRAQDARKQTVEGQVNTEKAVNALTDEMEDLISENENSGNGGNSGGSQTTVENVVIPEGYYYVGGTKAKGIVISDNVADKELDKGKENVRRDLSGNQWVWVPVETPSSLYTTVTEGVALAGSTVDGVPIPAGFVYVGGTKDSGLVISDATADKEKYKGQTTVGTDLVGNQFVWIPVDNIADYKRTAYSTNVATGTIDTATNSEQIKAYSSESYYFTEALLADEKTSVETNKGFYIGRYEAGDQESTNSKTLRKYGVSKTNTITVKAGQAPYNYITKTQAQSLAEDFSSKQGYTGVKSKLVSSYAWDTTIAFIQKTNSDYGNSSEEGNYTNSPTFTYTGIADTEKNKQKQMEQVH